jgi:hypothetical protein
LPTHLGGPTGLAIGVALLNCLALIGTAVFAYRRGGPLVGAITMSVAAALLWAMGSEVLYEPWQGFSVLLPFLFLLILVWSTACGDLVSLPFTAALASFVLQTHLTYSVLVPALGVWAIVGLALTLRRERRGDSDAWPARRRQALLTVALAGIVLALAWAQPLIQEFTSHGPGNLSLLVRSALHPHAQFVGYGTGAQLLASVVSLPPWWFRPSFLQTFGTLNGWRFPTLGLATASLAVLATVLVWCAWYARRNKDHQLVGAVVTASVAVVASLGTTAHVSRFSSLTQFAIFVPHTLRFLWPVAAFVFFVVLVTVVSLLRRLRVPVVSLVGGLVIVAVAFAALNLPTGTGTGPNSQEWAIPTLRRLEQQVGVLEHRGPLLVDDLFNHFGSPYPAVLPELQRRGISFVVKDATLVARFGPTRRFTGHNAKAALLMRAGDAALVAPAGARRVASVVGLSRKDQQELSRLQNQVGMYILAVGVRLNRGGQDAVRIGALPNLSRRSSAQRLSPEALFTSGELVSMVENHDLVLDRAWSQRFKRYAELQQAWDRGTIALFVSPLGAGEASPARSRTAAKGQFRGRQSAALGEPFEPAAADSTGPGLSCHADRRAWLDARTRWVADAGSGQSHSSFELGRRGIRSDVSAANSSEPGAPVPFCPRADLSGS